MYDSLISLTFISLLALINAQHSAEQDLLEGINIRREKLNNILYLILNLEINQPRRSSKSSFDAQFYRGQCPDRFYQLGNECVYFGTDGKRYSWQEVQHVCVERVARFLERRATFISGEIPIKPTKVLRQLILNTPQKTKILEALYQHFNELNFAVRIPSDYNTLHRCHDDKEDYWPQYCINPKFSNATCFETNQLGSNNICLSEIDCNKPTLRFACEFTLPGLLFKTRCRST